MNKEILKEYLSNRYQGWHSFLNNVIFPIFGEDDFEIRNALDPLYHLSQCSTEITIY